MVGYDIGRNVSVRPGERFRELLRHRRARAQRRVLYSGGRLAQWIDTLINESRCVEIGCAELIRARMTQTSRHGVDDRE